MLRSVFRALVISCAGALFLPVQTARALGVAGECRLDLAESMTTVRRAYQSTLSQCIKFRTNGACESDGFTISRAQEQLRSLFDPGASCDLALSAGVDPADVYPGNCAMEFSPLYCVIQLLDRLYGKLRYDLDLPMFVDSTGEQNCMRTSNSVLAKAVQRGMRDALSCAKAAGEPPWSCPLDLTTESRFGGSLASIDRKIARCRDASGDVGEIGISLSQICNRAVVSTGDLTSCIREAAICQTCLLSNLALHQNEDCAALSGDTYCSLFSSKPAENSFFVTNRADDSVTFFNEEAEYLAGALGPSTFAVGAAPVDVAVAERANSIFVVNHDANSVTALRADNGEYLNGTLAASTFGVGPAPIAALVNPLKDIVYVANSGDDSVTFLDAHDGSYVFGTLAASTFPVGDEPSALALNTSSDVLYVANAGDDTISLVNATTGMPTFGLASNSILATGAEPRALRKMPEDQLVVANAGDGSVWVIDEVTGLPWARGYGPAPTHDTAPGAVALASTSGPYVNTVYVALGDAGELISWGYSPDFAIGTVGTPSDLEKGGSIDPYYFEPSEAPLLVTISDRDVVSVVPAPGYAQPLGVTAMERSSISTPDLTVLAADSTRDELLARRTSTESLVVLDASDLSVLREIPVNPKQIRLDESGHTIYTLYEWQQGVTVIDSVTGEGRYGTLEQSTITCGCTYMADFAIDPSRNRLYLACDDHVQYVDTTTGNCLGGSSSTTGVPGLSYMCGIGVDIAAARVLASPCGGYAAGPAVITLDPLVPQYKNGTLAASTLVGGDDASWTLTPSPDGSQIFTTIGWGHTEVRIYDSTDGTLLKGFWLPSYSPLPHTYGYNVSFLFDEANDIVLAAAPGFAVALHISDLSFVGGDVYNSTIRTLEAGDTPHYGIADFMPAGPLAGAIVNAGVETLTFLQRPSLDYWIAEPLAAIREIPTGQQPSAIGVMPRPRISWRYSF